MVFHLSWCTSRWSLKRYLSFTLAWSCLQRLRFSALFPIPFAMPASQDRDPDAQFHCNPISYCGPRHPSTGAVRSPGARLAAGWSLFTHLAAHPGTGIRDLSAGLFLLEGPDFLFLPHWANWLCLVFLLLCRGYCCWHRLFLWFSHSWGSHNALLSSSPWGCCLVSSRIQK